MFQTTQTLHPVPTVFGAGFIAPRFEDAAHSKFSADDRDPLFKDFVNRLHALVGASDKGTTQSFRLLA
jgi:hypothetical protein